MESDAASELSEVSTMGKNKKSRFRTRISKKDTSRQDLASVTFGVKKSKSSTLKSMKEIGSDFDLGSPDKEDPIIRFSGDGVTFKAKLIGIDPVTSPRGDQMCKNAMTRLKAIVKGTGSHKQKIILSISLDGLKLTDEKTKEVISQHPIPLISYISRDTSDTRAFGFVYGSPSEGHQFIGIKTEKQAIPVMQTIADLFTFVYEKRKQEKSKDPVSPRSQQNVLTFEPKEEVFSTDKVNMAWKMTEPRNVSSPSSNIRRQQSSPAGSMLPPLLPPPRTESVSSRASTLNSSQKSDVLSELRTMRHVINSAQAAASSDRYATWESFNEAEANETLSQINSLNNNNGQSSVGISLDPIRPSSAARSISDNMSDHSSSHNFIAPPPPQSSGLTTRGGIGPRLPTSVMPMLVPSPPSSPRTNSRSRLRQGFTQPNQVALPPPNSMGSSTLSLQSSIYPSLIAKSTANPSIQRTESSASYVSPRNSFPAQSEPNLLSQDNFKTSSTSNQTQQMNPNHLETNKFEVNFTAVFPSTSFSPSNAVPPAPPTVPPNTSKSSDDRYACFQEIQNLANYPSIFDSNPSSSSDSDTFVGSPVPPTTSNKQNMVKEEKEDQDLFGGDISWSDIGSTTQVPASVNYPSLISLHSETSSKLSNGSSKVLSEKSEIRPQITSEEVTKSPRFVDTATSPGTPPGTLSSQTHHDSQSKICNEKSKDPFAMTAIFSELESTAPHSQDLHKRDFFTGQSDARNIVGHSSSASTVTANRVCPESDEHRPPSAASIASSSSQSCNPFSREEASRSDFEDYSCQRPPGQAGRSSSSLYAKNTVCGEFFDPYLYQRLSASSVAAAAFEAASFSRTGRPSQFMSWHMPPLPCSHPQMPNCQCQGYYCGRSDFFQGQDMRFHPMYHQMHSMYAHQQLQKNRPPTDFGPSFDFGPGEYDPRASYYHHGRRDEDSLSARSMSPNNPFSPVFPGRDPGQKSPTPPPRPPARTDERRMSNDSDPPPLPKRKPIPIGNYYQYPPGHYTPSPGMTSRQNYMSNYSPPRGVSTDPPPLPLPSRKKTSSSFSTSKSSTQPTVPSVERRVSFEAIKPLKPIPVEDPFDPFNVTYVDRKLNELPSSRKRDSSSSTSLLDLTTVDKKGFPDQNKISTPLNSAVDVQNIQPRSGDLNFSTISSGSAMNVTNTSDTVFDVLNEESSSAKEPEGYFRLTDKKSLELKQSSEKESNGGSTIPFNHFGDDHVSPPERNIFQPKDPFADDDFFTATSS